MTERKYRKPVNENGWMRKLQRWTFKKPPPFVGYCPFFWFTWLCILFIPLTLICKFIGLIFRFIGSAIPESVRSIHRPTNAKLCEFWDHVLEFGMDAARKLENTRGGLYYEDLVKWLDATPDWRNCLESALATRRLKQERDAAAAPAREAFARKASKYSAFIVKPILVIACMVAGYIVVPLAFNFGKWLVAIMLEITWTEIVLMLKFLAGGAALIGVMYLLILVICRIIEGFMGCPKCPEKVTWTYRAGFASGRFADFIAETIKALYTRECPLIEWGDRDEPIQPR